MSGPSAGAVEEIDRLRAAFERLARTDCARSPLSAEICLAVAGSQTTLALVMRAPAHQRRPTLLLAAIHDLLLAGAQHPLAAHYPTIAGGRRANGRPGDLALDFCAEYEQRLAGILARRSTQTNEVNRVAALLPALAHSTPPGATLRLVELGASAGLNLLADRYEVRYRGPGGESSCRYRYREPPHPRAVCECDVPGALPPRATAPVIASRIGADLHPIDVRDRAAARWLLACTWPDEPDRVARLRAAIAIARQDPPQVMRGNGLALAGPAHRPRQR